MLSLIGGLLAGLQRIGWTLPVSAFSASHGSIMVGGFLGTLITLEKVIPLRKPILYVIPIVSAASVLFFFLGLPFYSIVALLSASAGLSIVFFIYWFRERSLIYAIMFAGACCWLTGNALLLKTNFYPTAIPWWMAFILLIITAERLELMKFLPVTKNQKVFFVLALLTFLAGCVWSFHGAGSYVAAIALVIASIWLMRHDVVAINLKKTALSRYVGVALLSGYFSLLICGLLFPMLARQPLGYDALIHCFFIGFAFSMIFAHGPIILPGVLGLSAKPYHPVLYLWLILLHGSWGIRAIADLALDMQTRKYSGLVSAIAIVGYLLSMVTLTIRSQRAPAV
jgi:hypothetical protein